MAGLPGFGFTQSADPKNTKSGRCEPDTSTSSPSTVLTTRLCTCAISMLGAQFTKLVSPGTGAGFGVFLALLSPQPSALVCVGTGLGLCLPS